MTFVNVHFLINKISYCNKLPDKEKNIFHNPDLFWISAVCIEIKCITLWIFMNAFATFVSSIQAFWFSRQEMNLNHV